LIALTGFRHWAIFLFLIPALLGFQFIFGPTADMMKSKVNDLKGMQAYQAMWTANWEALRNPELSSQAAVFTRAEYEKKADYYFIANVGYFERVSLLKTGDKLVSATIAHGHTGWDVIGLEVSLLPPRFIWPDKPLQGPSSQLARFAGMVGDEDYTTSVSFGMFPELFHALGYAGVFFIGLPVVTLIFWWFRCFIGDYSGLTLYGLMLIGSIHHTIAEDLLGSFLNFFYRPIIMVLAILPVFMLVHIFGRPPRGPTAAISQSIRRPSSY
jgi:hypothetical protein